MSEINRKRLTAPQRQRIFDKHGGFCAYCGAPLWHIKNMQVDHIVPLYRGGKDEFSNMAAACRSCNHYKHTLTVEEFRAQIERIPAVLMRDDVTYQIGHRFGIVREGELKITFWFEKYKPADTTRDSEFDN